MMNRKHLIIFGRSPFINKLKLENINYNKYDICCINSPVPNIKKIDYLVSADEWVKPTIPDGCEWVSVNNGWELVKGSDIIQQPQKLSWKHYSSDLAVNFAIMRGYKHIYLAGIDLIPDGKPFEHYDGVINTKTENADGIRDEILLIRKLADKYGVSIYQLNPECTWLRFEDIGLL